MVNLSVLENITHLDKDLIYRQTEPHGHTLFGDLYGERRKRVKHYAEEKKKGEKRLVGRVRREARYGEHTAH